MRVPFARVDCSGNELDYVRQVLESGWLTTASWAQELERRIAAMVGAKHACAVNSCTSALHLALEAIGVGQGDQVLVPTWTFTASAEVIRYLGADPVFLDVDYGTSALTADIVEEGIRRAPNAKALIVVHFAGQAAPMLTGSENGILAVCRRHGVKVVEDAAHAFPSKEAGVMVGGIGDVTCFSFYANKTMTTGEGGMLVTDDDEIAGRAKLMRLHGIDRDVWDRFTSKTSSWEYDIKAPGYKYNMPDINAAIGLAQLERLEHMRMKRQQCGQRYLSNLSEIDSLDLPVIRVPSEDSAWHLFPVVLNKKSTITRNELIRLLAADGIGTSVHYKPLHRMSYYKDKYNLRPATFPTAERLWNGCLSLPIYATLSEEDQEFVIQRMKAHLSKSCRENHA